MPPCLLVFLKRGNHLFFSCVSPVEVTFVSIKYTQRKRYGHCFSVKTFQSVSLTFFFAVVTTGISCGPGAENSFSFDKSISFDAANATPLLQPTPIVPCHTNALHVGGDINAHSMLPFFSRALRVTLPPANCAFDLSKGERHLNCLSPRLVGKSSFTYTWFWPIS